jgi:hypothetical protein
MVATAQLTFHTIADSPEQKITFDTVCSPATPIFEELQNYRQATTHNRQATIYLDPEGELSKFGNLILFTVYLESPHQSAAVWEKCIVKESSVGRFVDRLGHVDFTTNLGGRDDDGTFDEMPLHCFCSRPVIRIEPVDSPSRVQVSGNDGLMVKITNESDSLHTTVLGKSEEITYSNPSYWKSSNDVDIGDGKPFDIEPKGSVEKAIQVRPNFVNALQASLRSLNSDQGYTSVGIKIGARTTDGGIDQPARTELPLRFYPSISILFCTLMIGSLLGVVTSSLLPGAWKGGQAFLAKIGKDLAISIAVYVVALLLVQVKSKFAVFGFELDPWQILPTAVIGFAVSGGRETLSAFGIEIFKRGKSGGT